MRELSSLKPIGVDSALEPLEISSGLLHDMCAHALETQPEECCGLVTGNPSERFLGVFRCQNVMTSKHQAEPDVFPRDGRQAYYMNEVDYLRAQREADSRGESVTAVYHSHVGAGLHFSVMDQAFAKQELFPFPDAAHIVLAVWDRTVQAAIFEPGSALAEFRGRSLEAANL